MQPFKMLLGLAAGFIAWVTAITVIRRFTAESVVLTVCNVTVDACGVAWAAVGKLGSQDPLSLRLLDDRDEHLVYLDGLAAGGIRTLHL